MRTVEDWIELAAASTGPEQAAHLAAAQGAATRAWEWRALLSAALKHDVGSPEWRGAVVDRLLVAAAEEGECWGFRDAAQARFDWGDPEGARAALELGLRSFAP